MAEYEWGLHRCIRCSEKKRASQVVYFLPGQTVVNRYHQIHHIHIPNKKKKGGTHSYNLPKRPYKRRRPFHATSYTHIRFLKSVLIANNHTPTNPRFFFFCCWCLYIPIFLCLSSYQFNFPQPQTISTPPFSPNPSSILLLRTSESMIVFFIHEISGIIITIAVPFLTFIYVKFDLNLCIDFFFFLIMSWNLVIICRWV